MSRYTADKSLPLGDRSFGNTGRWDSNGAKAHSEIVNKIRTLPMTDSSVPHLVVNRL
jgi:hypothetical protein